MLWTCFCFSKLSNCQVVLETESWTRYKLRLLAYYYIWHFWKVYSISFYWLYSKQAGCLKKHQEVQEMLCISSTVNCIYREPSDPKGRHRCIFLHFIIKPLLPHFSHQVSNLKLSYQLISIVYEIHPLFFSKLINAY